MSKLRGKGFTLIELMIVVTIIGLLAAVAMPKFSDMIKKAKQASSKSNLGVLRSVVSVYYADHYGNWPYESTTIADYTKLSSLDSLTDNAIVPTYLNEIPEFKSGIQSYIYEADKDVVVAVKNTFDYDKRWTNYTNAAAWVYLKDSGMWYVNCPDPDTKGVAISTW